MSIAEGMESRSQFAQALHSQSERLKVSFYWAIAMHTLANQLRDRQHPLVRALANTIESTWMEHLQIEPYSIPSDLGYIENHLEGETLIIENYCYQTPQFRKLHLELAQVGNGLDILHCVMFPRADYPLPMFGCDIVGARGQISAAIVDLSPIHADRNLPSPYNLALSQLTKPQFSQPRELPSWGEIFSPYCTFIRPIDAQEEQDFLQQVTNMLKIHCKIAQHMTPVTSLHERSVILLGQAHYCQRQRENDKTRRVLEKSFGTEWTDRYMNTMLFDCAPVSAA